MNTVIDVKNHIDSVTFGERLDAFAGLQNIYQMVLSAILVGVLLGVVTYFYRSDRRVGKAEQAEQLRRNIEAAQVRRDNDERPKYGDVRLLDRYERGDEKIMAILDGGDDEPKKATADPKKLSIRVGVVFGVLAFAAAGVVLWNNSADAAQDTKAATFQQRTADAVSQGFRLDGAAQDMPKPDQDSSFAEFHRVGVSSPALGCVVRQQQKDADTWRVSVTCDGVKMQAVE